MKVCSFLGGIPASNKNPFKKLMLEKFIHGVNAVGDQGVIVTQQRYEECDVAVIQGFVHQEGKQAPHLMHRQMVLGINTVKPKRCVIIDSNMFLFATPNDPLSMCRYSFDGVFPTTGEYCSDGVGAEHWIRVKNNYNINYQPWKKSGNHILICLQRNGGWSMQGEDVVDWLRKTVTQLREYTDRPIVVRGHPGDGKFRLYLQQLRSIKGISISDHTTKHITHDLNNAWATIVKNSSPSVASVMQGVPVFVTDPDHCQAKDVANTNLQKIESPDYFDLEQWLWKISASHWNINELADGSCWRHMKKYV
jgi:hypothetical protein